MKEIINLNNIVKKFYEGKENELEILHGISFKVYEGEFVSIVGPSGSGKSTLMNIIGALDRVTSGRYFLDGIDIEKADDVELSRIRNKKIGFVFQTYNLIAKTNAIKNVELPMLYAGVSRGERKKRAKELLETVEMMDRAKHLPEELSGGQKQRVAIARAMANNPSIILADEPTGALDQKTGRIVMDLFHKLNKEHNITILLITHSMELAQETDRIVSIVDGRIIDDKIINKAKYKDRDVLDVKGDKSSNNMKSKKNKGNKDNKKNKENKENKNNKGNKGKKESKKNKEKKDYKENRDDKVTKPYNRNSGKAFVRRSSRRKRFSKK